MSLNIKNERTHALVKELAERTGMSQTSAVESAVRLRLEQLNAQTGTRRPAPRYPPEEVERRIRDIERIVADFQANTTPEEREALSRADEDMYDELGLPK
jgi:antitoxin VapB